MPDVAGPRTFLRSAQFLRLYSTRVTSAVADGIFQAALASYVLFNPQNATTPGRAAAAFAAVLVPYSVAGPFAGVFLDRWYRQRVLVFGNTVKVLLVAAVAALVATGADGAVFFGAAIAALGVNRLFLSALSAALPHVVDEAELVPANAISTTSGSIATIAGAGIGGILRVGFGSRPGVIAAIVGLSAVAYAASAAIATTMARDLLGPDAQGRLSSREGTKLRAAATVVVELGQAIRYIRRRRRAAHALAAISAHRFLFGIASLTTVLLFRNYFSGPGNVSSGILGLGAVLGASGAGIVVGALITPAASRRLGTTRWITVLLAGAGVSIAVFGLPFQRVLLIIGGFLLGVSSQGVKICVDATVQAEISDEFRGRVFSVYDMLFNVTYVAAAAVAATVLPNSGKSTVVMALIVVGYAVAALAFAAVSARSGDLGRDEVFETPNSSSRGGNRP
ncbi:MAG: hypothetical protein QOJ62_1477 [Actinomycetota bacterium]|nr:hypothetical protein [Actinomycetota bacterium]